MFEWHESFSFSERVFVFFSSCSRMCFHVIACCRGYICIYVHSAIHMRTEVVLLIREMQQPATVGGGWGGTLTKLPHVSLRINLQHHHPGVMWWVVSPKTALIHAQGSSKGREPAFSVSSCCTNGDFQDYELKCSSRWQEVTNTISWIEMVENTLKCQNTAATLPLIFPLIIYKAATNDIFIIK